MKGNGGRNKEDGEACEGVLIPDRSMTEPHVQIIRELRAVMGQW